MVTFGAIYRPTQRPLDPGNSNINDVIATSQVGQLMQFCIYGDSAYMHLDESHIRARHNYDPLTARESIENRIMSSLREVIEWDYGDIGKYCRAGGELRRRWGWTRLYYNYHYYFYDYYYHNHNHNHNHQKSPLKRKRSEKSVRTRSRLSPRRHVQGDS